MSIFTPQANVALAPLTTLRLGGNASFFASAASDKDIVAAASWAKDRGVPLLVLGGGSNVVIGDAGWDGLVLHMRTRGISSVAKGRLVEVTVAAGEPWDVFVKDAVSNGWAGIECLAGIPGQVGSTPIQNVGAYGQDVAETIVSVRVWDRLLAQELWMPASDLGFSYRDSVLRREPNRWIVLDVVFALHADGVPSVRYAELKRELAATLDPSLQQVHDKVLELRRRKSMVLDPLDPNTQSAGSFFTNPIVDQTIAAQVVALAQRGANNPVEVPQWIQPDGRVKLAAGWLIEQSGFKRGHRVGAVGISSTHALALVHYGGGSASDLLALAGQVRQGVLRAFGVLLQAEPIVINAPW